MARLPDHMKAAIGVVMASRVLSSGAKLVWQKHLYLDEPGKGCRMSADNLGLLLGLGADMIDVHRRTLQRGGLLDRGTTTGKGATWSVLFPGEYLPRGERPSPTEYAAAGAALDGHLRARGLGTGSPDSSPGKTSNTPDQTTAKPSDIPDSSTANHAPRSPASVGGEPTEGSSVPSGRKPVSSVEVPADGGTDLTIGTDGGDRRGWEERRRAWREGLRST